jgi:hypothetical protein
MAAKKKPDLSGIFDKTEHVPAAPTEPDPVAIVEPESVASAPPTDRTLAVGVGLKESQIAELDRIAEDLDIARNNLIKFAVAYLLAEHSTGSVNLSRYIESGKGRVRLKMPSIA